MLESKRTSNWFPGARPNDRCRLRLFCFPYAGAGPQIFRTWSLRLSPAVEVCPVLLPGRGSRINEPPMTAMSDVVNEVALAIRPYLDRPFALFGHSLGALITFELARRLRQEENIGPVHLFASGCRAPQLTNREPPTHLLPEPEFLERLKELNGTPLEILAHPELMQLIVPLLRADFGLAETYNYAEAPPLNCSISGYGGLQDAEVDRVQLEAWEQQTSTRFTLRLFPGGHFFLHDAEPAFLNTLHSELLEIDSGLV